MRRFTPFAVLVPLGITVVCAFIFGIGEIIAALNGIVEIPTPLRIFRLVGTVSFVVFGLELARIVVLKVTPNSIGTTTHKQQTNQDNDYLWEGCQSGRQPKDKYKPSHDKEATPTQGLHAPHSTKAQGYGQLNGNVTVCFMTIL